MNDSIKIQFFIFFLAIVVQFFRGARVLRAQKQIAIAKGISPYKFTMMQFFLSLYVIPLIAYSLFRIQVGQSIIFPIVVILSFAPGIYWADSISDNLDHGYDYQKRASRVIKEYLFVGWFGMIYFSGYWALTYLAFQNSH
jgi:hypothetical protein